MTTARALHDGCGGALAEVDDDAVRWRVRNDVLISVKQKLRRHGVGLTEPERRVEYEPRSALLSTLGGTLDVWCDTCKRTVRVSTAELQARGVQARQAVRTVVWRIDTT